MFDVALSAVSLIVLGPIMVAAAMAILIEDGGPALFVHDRLGRHRRPFRVMKFRSMRVGATNVPSAEADDSAVTRVGALLRRTNLDELPQLINIIRGDMSIVGPRPAVSAQHQLIRLRVSGGACGLRPGLTGLAQINAYDGMGDVKKAEHDNDYASRVTFARDLGILIRTVAYLRKPPPKY